MPLPFADNPLAQLTDMVINSIFGGGRPWQGPMGQSYPAQPSGVLPENVLAQAPISGSPSAGSLPIRYQPGYSPTPGTERHEVSHALGAVPSNIDWSQIPSWAMDWATRSPVNPETGMYPQEGQDIFKFGGAYSGLGPAQQAQSPDELAADLFSMGFWNPPSPGAGGPSEDMDWMNPVMNIVATYPEMNEDGSVSEVTQYADGSFESVIAAAPPNAQFLYPQMNEDGQVVEVYQMPDGSYFEKPV